MAYLNDNIENTDNTDNTGNKVIIDVSLPAGWSELSQKQLKFAFGIIGNGGSKEYLITHCFLRWGKIRVLARNRKTGIFVLRHGGNIFEVSSRDMMQWMRPLGWLASVPDYPVVIGKVGWHKAVAPDFCGVIFDRYLDAIMIWNTFAESENESVLPMLVDVLYGFRPKRLKPWLKACVIYWMGALSRHFAGRFPHLFGHGRKSPDGTGCLGGGGDTSIYESINAMVRALTKGDVLKEKEVLKVDTHRALTELEAIGKEYDDMMTKMKQYERL